MSEEFHAIHAQNSINFRSFNSCAKPVLVQLCIWFNRIFTMNNRYNFQPDSLCNSGSGVSLSSATPSAGEDRMAFISVRNRSSRVPPSSFMIRMAMRISRARWFTFLRRVFHYQNGSRSDLGSNPFNTSTWMLLEFTALVVQLSISTIILSISKGERPVWPMRLWIVGYDIGCLLNLLLLYGRYRNLYLIQAQGDGLNLSDMEQQRGIEESRYFYMPPITSFEFIISESD